MQSLPKFEMAQGYASLWTRLQPWLDQKSIPSALLFISPAHANILSFIQQFIAKIMCDKPLDACGHCKVCILLEQNTHPDVTYVKKEEDKSIKIDHIRALQQDIYQTPLGRHRFIVLESADRMNAAAANALLKVLEEPPSHTVFILLAEQLESIPVTILSRCQKYIFDPTPCIDYLTFGSLYAKDSARSDLFQDSESLFLRLLALTKKEVSVCSIAAEWVKFNLEDLLWFLYLVTAQLIQAQLLGNQKSSWGETFNQLACLTKPLQLFNQLSQINTLTQKITHAVPVNPTLALETLLLGY